MIPVLGVPVLNRADLAARMVRSIDHPVRELVVVVNGPEDEIIPLIRDAVETNPNILKVLWSRPGFNLGCGGSWNFIIRSRPAGPWWLIVNADLTFGPGDLGRADTHMTEHGGFAMLFEYGAFCLDNTTVDQVGWFDENYHPIYFEDRDYEHRLELAGIPAVRLDTACHHDNSSTIHSDSHYAARNNSTFQSNAEYFVKKWGNFPRQGNLWSQPYAGHHPVVLSRQRLAHQSW
jgi:GT2 family glycosyltransferase